VVTSLSSDCPLVPYDDYESEMMSDDTMESKVSIADMGQLQFIQLN